jgi:phospholipase C
MAHALTRRRLLQAGAASGAALGAGALLPNRLIDQAIAASPACGSLQDIDHVVFLIQENRSFDHYFGSYRGVTGFGDYATNPTLFQQPGYPVAGYGGHLNPWHLDTNSNGECSNDITHSWGPQHRSWDGGAMDGFVREHEAADPANAALTMAYYKRPDLAFYYALADAFTICDHYHCSVIGPTDPNRLYSISGTIDPDGQAGGPLVETLFSTRLQTFGKFTWKTMPEQLEAAGVSWKVYSTPDGNLGDNVLPYFKAYQQNVDLARRALLPTFPGSFEIDCATGRLPAVSWVLAPLINSEHPPAPVEYGQFATATVLKSLVSNPDLWARTALFITWDENGGFFDHVAPPTAPAGTPGEFLTVSPLPAAAEGIAGPIGLGFRVPMLVVSPFSRGGFVASSTFDHTSMLRFLEARFGTPVPNLSAWRRGITGDLTSAFNFAAVDASVPALPKPSLADQRVLGSDCPTKTIGFVAEQTGQGTLATPVLPTNPVPPNSAPSQEAGSAPSPSGPVTCAPTPAPRRHLIADLVKSLLGLLLG